MKLTIERVVEMLNPRKNSVLLVAQAALPNDQFEAFKKYFLNELGERGFVSDLKRLECVKPEWNGMGGK